MTYENNHRVDNVDLSTVVTIENFKNAETNMANTIEK
jgi:hypothetical protein